LNVLNSTYLIHYICIIQLEFSLLDQLHASNSHNHLRATCNPKHRVHIHFLGAIDTLLSTSMRKYFIAIFVDGYEYCAGDFGLGCGCGWT
jgi:hypothetical protein